MLNVEKLKLGNRVYNKNDSACERGIVQSITPTGKVRVKYENGKVCVHTAAQITRRPPTAPRKYNVKKTKKAMAALDIFKRIPDNERAILWKAVVSTGLTIREVLEVKGLLP